MKKLFLLLIILSFSLFSKELEMRKIKSITIIEFESENSQILQESKSENLFYGIDIEEKLRQSKYRADMYFQKTEQRLFDREVLKQIGNESAEKTNKALKNEIESLKLELYKYP